MLMTGGLMLMGGGICAASNALFMVGNARAFPMLAMLFLVSCLVAWAGWWVIKISGTAQPKRSTNKSTIEAEGETGNQD
jgi:hypothetical protein